jgi:hypothetical protein
MLGERSTAQATVLYCYKLRCYLCYSAVYITANLFTIAGSSGVEALTRNVLGNAKSSKLAGCCKGTLQWSAVGSSAIECSAV